MKTFLLKLFCFMLIVSTTLFIGTACNNDDFVASEGLEFEMSSDRTGYAVIGIGDCFDRKVVIPLTYNDKPVVEIKKEAFKEDPFIEEVIITNNVTSIGDYAFINCDNLTSVTIGNSVTSIGYSAFENCDNLTSVTIGNSVESIVGAAFYGCDKLVEVINKSPYITVTKGSNNNGYLGDYALSVSNRDDSYVSKVSTDSNGFITYTDGNDKILVNYIGTNTNITIPSVITEIYKYAFRNCTNLTSVTIGNSVTSIGEWAFSGCDNLTSITIPNSVTSIGKSTFYECANLTSVTIGNSVESIGGTAFANCDNLTSITIPNSVTSIGEWAFSGCDNLTSITIPNSVTSIGYYAFYNCRNLRSITYKGTKYKWNSISKGSCWNDDVPATYVTCTDGKVYI